MRTLTLLLALLAGVLAYSPAMAAHHHHRHHYRHHAHHYRFSHYHHRVRVVINSDNPEPQGLSLFGGRPLELHPLLSIAKRYIGRGKVTHYGGPWCRDFVNKVAAEAGVRLRNHSRRAVDALGLGRRVRDPRPGDLVVMRHHVTIFAGFGGRGIIGLGGNQGHRVKYSNYSRRQVMAYVRVGE